MKEIWWKVLGVLLMLYVIIMGLLTPLRPGITGVNPQNISSGERVALNVETYNAELEKVDENALRAWLLRDTTYVLAASSVKKVGEQSLQVVFELPANLPISDEVMYTSLVVDAPGMGSIFLPEGIFIAKGGADFAAGESAWTASEFGGLNQYEKRAIPFDILNMETMRNLYFHVSLWFSMFILFFVSVIYSIRYLRKRDPVYDQVSSSLVEVGTLFGILGIVTGALWAKNTWGTYWTTDVKLNMAAVSMMIYAAYLVLRISIKDEDKKAVISSSYSIFAFFIIIPLIFVIPRLTDSLHPGNGGNPGFGGADLDNTMRMVFYPAIIAFTLMGLWFAQLMIRFKKIRTYLYEK